MLIIAHCLYILYILYILCTWCPCAIFVQCLHVDDCTVSVQHYSNLYIVSIYIMGRKDKDKRRDRESSRERFSRSRDRSYETYYE